jgi:cold shock CspA family protein
MDLKNSGFIIKDFKLRSFLFIKSDAGEELFAHYSEFADGVPPINSRVNFTRKENPPGSGRFKATKVSLEPTVEAVLGGAQ